MSAAQAAKAVIHFFQTRRPHHGDILIPKPKEKKKKERHDWSVSSSAALRREDDGSPRGAKNPLPPSRPSTSSSFGGGKI